ncbi:MAG: hypothetical protein U0166_21455 [Acidobacteriota bacterium]
MSLVAPERHPAVCSTEPLVDSRGWLALGDAGTWEGRDRTRGATGELRLAKRYAVSALAIVLGILGATVASWRPSFFNRSPGRGAATLLDAFAESVSLRSGIGLARTDVLVVDGLPFELALAASGGLPPYTFTEIDPLPAELHMSDTGVLIGTIRDAPSRAFRVLIVDGVAQRITVTIRLRAFCDTREIAAYRANFRARLGYEPSSLVAAQPDARR